MIGEMDKQEVIERTRRWIASFVIGFNLCPFAQRVFQADRIRYIVSDAEDEEALRAFLTRELHSLASAPITSVETTLLIHPRTLTDFLAYNDFLDVGERLLRRLGLEGVIQIASFHPDYQFAGIEADAVENYTNRSPYPMLHLLREDSIAAVAGNPAELAAIPARNVETLRALGKENILGMLEALKESRP
jgi:hypothetical protein